MSLVTRMRKVSGLSTGIPLYDFLDDKFSKLDIFHLLPFNPLNCLLQAITNGFIFQLVSNTILKMW